MIRIKKAVVKKLLAKPGSLSDEDTLKVMIMLKDISNNGMDSESCEWVTKAGDQWLTNVKAALTALAGVLEGESLYTLGTQINKSIFSHAIQGDGTPLIDPMQTESKLTSAINNSQQHQFTLTFQNEPGHLWGLNPVTMELLDNGPQAISLEAGEKKLLQDVLGITVSTGYLAKAGENAYKRIGVDGNVMVQTDGDGFSSLYYNQKQAASGEEGLSDNWLKYVDSTQINPFSNSDQNTAFKKYINLLGGRCWTNSEDPPTTFVYDKNMVCLFKIEEGKVIRESDQAVLNQVKSGDQFEIIWKKGDKYFKEITINKVSTLTLQAQLKSDDNYIFCDDEGFQQMDVRGAIVLKHPNQAEFKSIEFDAAGIPIIKTTKHPSDGGLMAVQLKKEEVPNQAGVDVSAKNYTDASEVTSHAIGADALSQLLDIARKKGDALIDKLHDQFLTVFSSPSQHRQVDEAAFIGFINSVDSFESPAKELINNLIIAQLPLIQCKKSTGSVVPAKVLFQSRLNYKTPEFPAHLNMNLKNTLAISHLKIALDCHQPTDAILNQISVAQLDPIQKRALTQLLIGLEGAVAKGLKMALNIDQDIDAKATYTSVMAKAIQATAKHQSDQKMVTKDPAYALIMGKSPTNIATALESCNESIQQMEARLDRFLRQKKPGSLNAQ